MNSEPRTDSRIQRIVFAHDTNRFGGVEIYLLRFLRHLDRDKITPFVLVPGYEDPHRASPAELIERVRAAGVSVLSPPNPGDARGVSGLRDVWNIRRLLRRVQADVVHIHTARPEGARKVTLAASLAGVPVIMRTEHNPPLQFGNPAGNKALLRFFDRLTDRILTVSRHNRREQIELFGRNPAQMVASYTGIELDQFDPHHDVGAAKAAIGFPADVPVVGAIGRLAVEKGFTHFIAAAARILDRHDAVNFILVGDGELSTALQSQIDEVGIGARFHMLGYKPDPVPYIEAMDITVMPSLSEGFPLSLLEYMALGKPAVVSDFPAIQEAVVAGESAVVVKMGDVHGLADGILELLERPTEARRLGENARRQVEEKYDFRHHVHEVLDLYQRVLAEK